LQKDKVFGVEARLRAFPQRLFERWFEKLILPAQSAGKINFLKDGLKTAHIMVMP
jgi:hypothetical protein